MTALRSIFPLLFCLTCVQAAGAVTDVSGRFNSQPFDLRDVELLDSPFKAAMDENADYLLQLEPDRFLHYFRTVAGLPPKAPPYDGWESATENGGCGRCLGHYLSALSLQYRASGDKRFKNRIDYIVAELALCQKANGDGYVGAVAGGKEAFAELAKGNADALKKRRVPWYILHKMAAGLRDAHELAGNQEARDVLLGFCDWADHVTNGLDDAGFQRMLEQEHGGIREVIADVYGLTGEARYLALARRFYHTSVMTSLLEGRDQLDGLHANTQIPKIVASARMYELTGDEGERKIAEFFWKAVVKDHTYAIGGNSDREAFGTPHRLLKPLGIDTCETCNTYNMLKLTRHLMEWDQSVEYADYYERALYNHILASIGPKPGNMTYYVSMKPGHFRVFSSPFDSFWCCVGTGMENHAQYGNSIYFHGVGTNADNLYVNLFISSQLKWAEKGLMVRLDTKYPADGDITLTLKCLRRTHLTFRIRYPAWAEPGIGIFVNGKNQKATESPGSYVAIAGDWNDGDQIGVHLPIALRMERQPDVPDLAVIYYGPLVLGGDLGSAPRNELLHSQTETDKIPDPAVASLDTRGRPIGDWLLPIPNKPMTFLTKGVGFASDVTLSPFYTLGGERYTVYWSVK